MNLRTKTIEKRPRGGRVSRTQAWIQQDRCQALTTRMRSIVIDLSAFRTRKVQTVAKRVQTVPHC
ncbi:MAG: hypothetical protein EBS62_09550 [Betaproteobacteria bacterium]|nr:hypothetical protein [Betaproteobacteria bacterium]NCX01451.1 hypothetical protein [Betaproteobacteria bacterium]